jgi:hypothetical protein
MQAIYISKPYHLLIYIYLSISAYHNIMPLTHATMAHIYLYKLSMSLSHIIHSHVFIFPWQHTIPFTKFICSPSNNTLGILLVSYNPKIHYSSISMCKPSTNKYLFVSLTYNTIISIGH